MFVCVYMYFYVFYIFISFDKSPFLSLHYTIAVTLQMFPMLHW